MLSGMTQVSIQVSPMLQGMVLTGDQMNQFYGYHQLRHMLT